jgi:hypothetical protein
MAAITSANVTIHSAYEIGDRTGKSKGIRMTCSVVLTAQGAAAGDLPASAFGLKQITAAECLGSLVGGNPRGQVIGVSALGADGNYIYPLSIINATDANRATPADFTGTLFIMLEGIPAA